jgi:hypothetical protein
VSVISFMRFGIHDVIDPRLRLTVELLMISGSMTIAIVPGE